MSEDDTTLVIAEIDALSASLSACYMDVSPMARSGILRLGQSLARVRRRMEAEKRRAVEAERATCEQPVRRGGWLAKGRL